MRKKTLIIGLSGASGVPISIALLKALKNQSKYVTHLVVSKGTLDTLKAETNLSIEDLLNLADYSSSIDDLGASIASGTFPVAGMIICPCSMKTIAGIAHGYSDNLLLRAADVTQKEKRKLLLVPREVPLSDTHLKNMLTLSQMGVVILPPMMTFYIEPQTAENMIQHLIGKIFDHFDLDLPGFQRWGV